MVPSVVILMITSLIVLSTWECYAADTGDKTPSCHCIQIQGGHVHVLPMNVEHHTGSHSYSFFMSSVRPNRIITSSSTCEAKTQPQCHLVAQSEKPYEFTPWHVNTLRHCSVTEASMVGCVLRPTDSEVI